MATQATLFKDAQPENPPKMYEQTPAIMPMFEQKPAPMSMFEQTPAPMSMPMQMVPAPTVM